jgi:hypothetical protein
MANFYNISTKLYPNYSKDDPFVIDSEGHDEKIINFLSTNKEIKTGDIIFAGSPHDRQCYGFYLVDKRSDIKIVSSEQGVDLPFENESLLNYLMENQIKYKQLFKNLNKFYSELIGFMNLQEVINNYQRFNLW